MPASHGRPRKRLSLLDCVALGINGVVGSGIFLLPGRMAGVAGPSSILAFLTCGLVFVLVALCFAEAAGMFESSGGAFLYARVAFGDRFGFAVGWMALCEGTIGFAAGARGLASQVARLVPALSSSAAQALLAGGFILLLGAINAAGLKKGAYTSDALSLLKLLPIVALVALGLWHFHPAKLTPFFAGDAHGFAQAAFLAVFACSGFEYVAVPAGEAAHARSDVPKAVVGALVAATLLYALVQLALVGSTDIAGSAQPLSDAAQQLIGPVGGTAILIAAVVSMAGFCASSALIGPRLYVAFADDGLLPDSFRRMHPRLGTPLTAIAFGCGTSALAAFFLPFDRLVDISNVALFAQYLPTCLAVMVLRRTRPELPRTYRAPLGDAVPVLAIAASIAMTWIAKPALRELLWSAVILVVGFGYYALWRRARPLKPGTP